MVSVGEVSHADGVIVLDGPTASFEDQVLCCKKARQLRIPFLGICRGLQAAAVDVARHLAHFPKANSVEYAPDTSVPLDPYLPVPLFRNRAGPKASLA